MGRERAVVAKAVLKEKPQLLRVRSHDEAVGMHPVSSVVFSSKVQKDNPAGHATLEEIISDPNSVASKILKKEKDWQKLKFIFPATARGDEVLYARRCKDSKEFLLREGGISYSWRKDFRTVHLK